MGDGNALELNTRVYLIRLSISYSSWTTVEENPATFINGIGIASRILELEYSILE